MVSAQRDRRDSGRSRSSRLAACCSPADHCLRRCAAGGLANLDRSCLRWEALQRHWCTPQLRSSCIAACLGVHWTHCRLAPAPGRHLPPYPPTALFLRPGLTGAATAAATATAARAPEATLAFRAATGLTATRRAARTGATREETFRVACIFPGCVGVATVHCTRQGPVPLRSDSVMYVTGRVLWCIAAACSPAIVLLEPSR